MPLARSVPWPSHNWNTAPADSAIIDTSSIGASPYADEADIRIVLRVGFDKLPSMSSCAKAGGMFHPLVPSAVFKIRTAPECNPTIRGVSW